MNKFILILAFLSVTSLATAKDIEFTDAITQDDFKNFVKEFGTALSFNPMAPAEPLGITGFDVSLEMVVTDISDQEQYWQKLVDENCGELKLNMPFSKVQW